MEYNQNPVVSVMQYRETDQSRVFRLLVRTSRPGELRNVRFPGTELDIQIGDDFLIRMYASLTRRRSIEKRVNFALYLGQF